MKFNDVVEKAIKEHCKEREYLQRYKGIKVLSCEYKQTIECYNKIIDTQYKVVCKMSAKKYENNRIMFTICVYSDGGKMTVYFDGTFYEC